MIPIGLFGMNESVESLSFVVLVPMSMVPYLAQMPLLLIRTVLMHGTTMLFMLRSLSPIT